MAGMPSLPPLNLASSSSAESSLSKGGNAFNFAPVEKKTSTTEKIALVGGFLLLAGLFYYKVVK